MQAQVNLAANWQYRYSQAPIKMPGLQDVRDKAALDPKWFMENYLTIATKKRIEQKLKFDRYSYRNQLDLWNKIEERRLFGQALRFIVLKSRQVGLSTLIAGYGFARWWSERNLNVLLIAHLKQVTSNLFKKNRKFYVDLPPELRIPLERSNKQELIMDMAYGGSQLFLTTAGSPHEARSQTIHFVHGSEAAFYADLFELKDALEASVPDDDDTAIFWESTAFGAGTPFHQLWQAGLSGDSIYESVFLPWMDDPQHSVPSFENDRVKDMWLEKIWDKAPDLQDRMEHFQLTAEQVAWYFITCHNKYKGEWIRMQQEFPCTPDEAFLASGLTIIPSAVIEKYRDKTRDGDMLDPTGEWSAEWSLWKYVKYLERGKNSYLEVFSEPKPRRHYLIVIDPASGTGEDYSVALVFDIVTQNLVAELHGKIETKKLAQWSMRLGKAYNNAVICVETNGLGLAVLSHIEDKYAYLYRQRTRGSIQGTRITEKYGWHMTEDMRWVIIANLRRVMIERLHPDEHPEEFIPSKGLIGELGTFIQPPTLTQKPQAEKGCHDDRVIAVCIGLWACIEEMQSRPDIVPIVSGGSFMDNDDELDVDGLDAMVADPNWTGQGDYSSIIEKVAAPFVPGVELSDNDYDELEGDDGDEDGVIYDDDAA